MNMKDVINAGANQPQKTIITVEFTNGRASLDLETATGETLGEALSKFISSGANLSDANLYGANLSDANLRGADLSGADLSGAENIPPLALAQSSIVPETGAFEGFKKLRNGTIAHLLIPADAKRSNATGRKCRSSQAKVLAIWDADGKPKETGTSMYNSTFQYRVGRTVRPDDFCEDRFQECASGIHFFLTRIEAENYQ